MKLGLYENIKTKIDAYHANNTTQQSAIKAVLEPFKTPSYANRFTQEGLRQTIKEQTDAINADWKKFNTTLNQQTRATVAEAQNRLLNALNVITTKKPDDYAIRIANAREFMKDELAADYVSNDMSEAQYSDLDDALFLILKDFIDDYDTMKLFSKMVDKKVILVGATGEPALPKTFGKMMKIDSIMNTLVEVMEASTMIFLHAKNTGEEIIRIKGDAYMIPMDGYSQVAEEEAILNYASILDDLADVIDDEGHSQTSGEGQNI